MSKWNDLQRAAHLPLTSHAATRMSQRGIRAQALKALLAAGQDTPCGGRSSAYILSKAAASELREAGVSSSDIDRIRRLRAIVAENGAIVTVMHRYDSRRVSNLITKRRV